MLYSYVLKFANLIRTNFSTLSKLSVFAEFAPFHCFTFYVMESSRRSCYSADFRDWQFSLNVKTSKSAHRLLQHAGQKKHPEIKRRESYNPRCVYSRRTRKAAVEP